MSTAEKKSLSSVMDMFADVKQDDVGDLPSFDPFPVGVYHNLHVSAEIVTSGKKESKDFWERLEIGLNMDENTEIELAQADELVPADGSQYTFTYNIQQSDKDTGEVRNVTSPHQATNKDGETYDSAGTFARLNKDWIQASKGQIGDKDIPALMKILASEPRITIQLGKRLGKANDEGVKPVYQQIIAIKYPE